MKPRGESIIPTIASCKPMPSRYLATLLLCFITVAGSGCKQEASSTPAQLVPAVVVTDVVVKDVPVYSEWVGSTDGMVNAVIRAQVSGYLLKRPYTEGSFVKKGELLFELDPSKFRAALDQAEGDLAKAQAHFMKTKQDVERDTPLAKQGAISQKELDDSIQAHAAAKGNTASAKASAEQAKLNLGGPGSRRRSAEWWALPRPRSVISSMPIAN